MMDRLTKWDEANEIWLENHDNDTREWKNGSRAIMDKLAAYEDAAPLEKAQEWAKAEQEGRLVALPCAALKTVWVNDPYWGDLCEGCLRWISVTAQICFHISAISTLSGKEFFKQADNKQFGKTVFLTREEAQASLDEQEGADPHA